MKRDLFADQNLPYLRHLRDRRKMGQLFESHFQCEFPQRALRVEDCTIEKVNYRLRKHCGVLYRLQLRDSNGRRFDRWFFGKMYPPEVGPSKFEKASARAGPPSNVWQPVSFWPELDMVVWAFPHDPKLSHLPEVVRPASVAKLVEENAEALGLAAGTKCKRVYHRRVKYMPGKRCVLRFEVEVANPLNGVETFSFFGKTYRDQTSRYVYEVLENARASAACVERQMEVPRPLLHVDDLHTYWQEVWQGYSLSALYKQSGWEKVLPRIASALAAFHRSDLPHLVEASSVERVAEEAVKAAIWVGQCLPDDRQHVRDLAERIKEVGSTLGPVQGVPSVPIHGAFRMSQLLIQEDRLAVVDFDKVAQGDPHYDVAEFMTSLVYQYFRRDLPVDGLMLKAELFRDAYADQVPWSCDRRRLAWYMAAFLLEKFHGSLKGLEVPILPKIDEVFGLVDHRLRGALPRN